jgi:hypothetical protein
MFQDTSTNQTATEDAANPSLASWWSDQPEAELMEDTLPVDSYADSLMDELFEDVDRILERGGQVPPEPAKPDFVSLQPLAMPQMILPPILMPRSQSPSQLMVPETDADVDALVAAVSDAEAQRETNSAIDRLLLSAACISAVACGILWLAFHRPTATRTVDPAPTPTAEQLQAQQNIQFLDYMQRSLAVIDRKAEANRVAAAPGANALPPVTVPGSAASATAGTPTVLERVYIPVYQPPQTLYPLPNMAPVAPAAPAPIAPAIAPAAPVASAPAAPSAVAVAPSPAAPAVMHVLVGVMQLGDRSAALFEIDGVTQRIYIGESIGGSGWTLVSISNQEAIVRRNGEVRSVYVGQQF